MWLVSCRRQGMLTQGPAPDSKRKLNISSFLTLQHLLDCLICTRNSVSIVLLSWIMGGSDSWGMVIHIRVHVGDRAWVLSHSLIFLLVVLSFVLSCPVSFFKGALNKFLKSMKKPVFKYYLHMNGYLQCAMLECSC